MPKRREHSSHVITGRVIKPYGVLGWVKVVPLSANPRRFQPGNSFILEGEEAGERLLLEEVREGSGVLLVKFRGLQDREEANELSGRLLLVEPSEVGEAPPGSFWEHQLLGLEVRTRDGRCLGEVAEVLETGANDVLVVRGKVECLIPMTGEVVKEIDIEQGAVTIEPLPGLLEE
ncbi:MAG: ribosome maturation factor RimM [Actinomycetota bacterium]